MKKLIIGIILIAPIAILGSTWFISNETETVFDKLLRVSQQKFAEEAPFIKVKKKSYTKGFLSSTASTIVTVEADKISEQQAFDVTLSHTIYHGPVMLTTNGLKIGSSYILTSINQQTLSSKVKQAIKQVFNNKQPISSSTHSDFMGNINVGLEIPSINFDSVKFSAIFAKEDKNKTKLTLDHLSSQFTTDVRGSFLKGSIDFGELNITSNNSETDIFNLVINQSVTQFNIDELYKGSMLLGSIVHNSPSLSFSNKDINISLKNIILKSVVKNQNGFYNELASLDAEKVFIQPTATAPVFPESKLHLGFAVNGLNREASMRLIDATKTLGQSQLAISNAKDLNPEQIQANVTKDLINYIKTVSGEILTKGIDMKQNVKISTETGTSVVNIDSSYQAPEKIFKLKTIGDLVKAFKIDLLISIDKSMVAGTVAAEAFNNPMTSGFVVEDEKSYQLSANLNKGYLKLNGLPSPFLQMMVPMFKQPLNWDELLND